MSAGTGNTLDAVPVFVADGFRARIIHAEPSEALRTAPSATFGARYREPETHAHISLGHRGADQRVQTVSVRGALFRNGNLDSVLSEVE